MVSYPRPACFTCKHFDVESRFIKPVCVAFPKGIPEEIYYEGNPHTDPYKGDHGIRYEVL